MQSATGTRRDFPSTNYFYNLLSKYRLWRNPAMTHQSAPFPTPFQQSRAPLSFYSALEYRASYSAMLARSYGSAGLRNANKSLRNSNSYLKYQIRNAWTMIRSNGTIENIKEMLKSRMMDLKPRFDTDQVPSNSRTDSSQTLYETSSPMLWSDSVAQLESTIQDEKKDAANRYIWNVIWEGFPIPYRLKPVELEEAHCNLTHLYQLHVYNSGTLSETLAFSFAACDMLVFYELGVALAIQQMIKPIYLRDASFVGSEAGSLPATALALNIDIDRVKDLLICHFTQIR